ncbi:ubiquitin-specific protease ubp2 [Pestalotiopsis sp. 9143b]|nr:ubiquitin-specific protease ubp2 [Pestalotiopsis sp. 9143b]
MADANDFAAPGGPNDRVFISSRLLAQLISGELFRNGQDGCETHELLLIPSQSGKESRDSTLEVISCICRKCRYHFRISVNSTIDAPGGLSDQHQPRTHMFLLYNRDSNVTLEATRGSGDFVLDRLHLSCIADKCNYKMVLERLPPRISAQEVEAMQDKKRVAHNFEIVRAEHRDRFKDLDNWVPDLFAMLQRYSKDCIETKPDESPKKIKRHNKKFLVAFKDDFDPLLRSLGCTLKVIDDGDEAWVFPVLENPSSPTMCGTLRAKWEDVEAECMVLMELMSGTNASAATTGGIRKVRPAWDMLQRAFACEKNESAVGYPSVNEADMALLGCLPYYKPMAIFEAARLLSDRFPRRALEFTQAARRSIGDRDSLASNELAMFESNIVNVPDMERLEGALNFFSAYLSQKDQEFYVNKYFQMTGNDDSSSFRSRALEYITIVGKYLNTDLRRVVCPDEDTSTNQMSLSRAQAILGDSAPDWGEDVLLEIVNNKIQDASVDNTEIAKALEVYAEHTRSSNPGLAARYEEMSGFYQPEVQNATGSYQRAAGESLDPYTPPGLGNIGNTCYLNSLLQYLYSVVPVRNLVLRYPEQSLDLNSETAIGQRILPIANGLRVSREEAIIGRQFVESLQALFQDLSSTTDVYCEPPQRLANTALRSASALLGQMTQKAENENTTPPLPAHSSEAPAETASSEANKISVTVEPINDPVETASDVSSQTLVNDDSAMSIDKIDGHGETTQGTLQPMADSTTVGAEISSTTASPGISNLDTVTNTISQFLELSSRKGTDQQDVEEIIGFILEHIMRAISSTGLMADQLDLQADAITDTFFPIFINYVLDMKNTEKKPGVELIPDRWINVLPDAEKGVSSTIHEALARFFTLQMLDSTTEDRGPRAQYSALRKLAPIMHIRIGRATSDSQNRVTKNENPVLLVDELYLDRYMDAPQDSELYRMRVLDWTMRAHRKKLEEVDEEAQKITPSKMERSKPSAHETEDDMAVDDANTLDPDEDPAESALRSSPLSSDSTKKRKISPDDDAVCLQAHTVPVLTKVLAAMGESTTKISDANDTEKKVTSYYESLQEHKYRLHSVICHSGGASAGHYWVWIRDFERNCWLKYNDSVVTVDKRDPQAVIDELNKSGDPCYVAYVRDHDKSDLVGIPQRTPIIPKEPKEMPSQKQSQMQRIDGVEPDDDVDMTDSRPEKFIKIGNASTPTQRLSERIF